MESESRLVRLCIEAACQSRESIEKWRKQRRTLERMHSVLADALLHRLLQRRLLFPSLLEVFKSSVEEVHLRGENTVDAEWMAYIGAFRYLRSLNLADCHRLNSSALWPLIGMTRLKEVDLSRCVKVTDDGIRHLVSISTLEVLRLSGTGLTEQGIMMLSTLGELLVLDLGDLPVTDRALTSLQALVKLEYLDLWGSNITNKGVPILRKFPKLSYLSLAWTGVTSFPNMPSIGCLNLSNCIIDSSLEGDGNKTPLTKLILAGATIKNEADIFSLIESSSISYLDISNSSLSDFSFLSGMKALQHLDLSSSIIGDDSIEWVCCIGANLRNLNLNRTRVTSAGVSTLAPHVPQLEVLSLSHAPIDDISISFIGTMTSLKALDLSNTKIKGFIRQEGAEADDITSLTNLVGLKSLESLKLEHTQVADTALVPLSNMKELGHLSLRSASLTDNALHHLSHLSKLTNLGLQDAVLTDKGLESFKPPSSLKVLDLSDCWLLTEDAIMSFCRRHPLIEVRHEHLHTSSTDQAGGSSRSPSLLQVSSSPSSSSRRSPAYRKQSKRPISLPVSHYFIDQRLKYSREELLAMQYQSLSLESAREGEAGVSAMQSD
ncbi:Internalin I [Linum grandiflorum]